MKLRSTSRGFTLVELIVTITIMIILTGIVITSIGSSRAKARDASRISDISQIQFALQVFYDRCGQYPTALVPNDTGGGNCPSGITLGSFISVIPTPSAGAGQTVYDYATLNNSGGKPINYVLHAHLEYYNAAVAKGLPASFSISSFTPTPTYTCSNTTSSVDYCVTSN